MPELPDLFYIETYLRNHVVGRRITSVTVKQSIVIRAIAAVPLGSALRDKTFRQVRIHGPFLHFTLTDNLDLVINLMLSGRLQHQRLQDKPAGYLCLALSLDDGCHLNYLDDQKMGKVYLTTTGNYAQIPRFLQQGIDIRSSEFTVQKFHTILKDHRRKQVYVALIDQTILSSIGHAYADEILFDAGIHPKTWTRDLSDENVNRLFGSITRVIEWGKRTVEKARQPIHVKVRDHMKVRLRHGKACQRCGTTIRREGVRGWDVYFCPTCQPASRRLFIEWSGSKGEHAH